MVKIHVISDLFLGFNESSPEEEIIPDVDLVVLNGNIGQLKRSMFYAETLCKKYPQIQFIFNNGETEIFPTVPKFVGETDESISVRKLTNASWPKNLHWSKDPMMITCSNNVKIDVLCTYGFPKIINSTVPWETTEWYKNHVLDMTLELQEEGSWSKPKESSAVRHGAGPVFPSIERINQEHEKELVQVRNWELAPSLDARFKMLVTHVNPFKDARTDVLTHKPYLFHLNKGIWISSNQPCNGVQFLGGKLYSNPGRGPLARQKIITVN